MVRSPAHGIMRCLVIVSAILVPSLPAFSQEPAAAIAFGDAHQITLRYETASESSDGSSSSSRGTNTLVERAVGRSDAGLTLEYDLPRDATEQDRAAGWQLPVRVFKPFHQALELLNADELEARVDPWLDKAGWTRDACGRWIFTWNAFRIECDPKSVLEIIQPFDLRPDLRDGALYHHPMARAPAVIERQSAGPIGATYLVKLDVDPVAVRREGAESDVVVGEIMGEPKTLEAALEERSAEAISGTITITFETNSAGQVHRRTTQTELQIRTPDDTTEKRTSNEVVERRVLSPGG